MVLTDTKIPATVYTYWVNSHEMTLTSDNLQTELQVRNIIEPTDGNYGACIQFDVKFVDHHSWREKSIAIKIDRKDLAKFLASVNNGSISPCYSR